MIRSLVAGFLAATALPLLTSIAPSAQAAPADQSTALQNFGGCLANNNPGQLLLVFDTSASLKQTDPGDQRIEAAQYLVDGLASSARAGTFDLDVAVAGFADDFTVAREWTPLDADGTSALKATVDSFADQDNGFETDYWNALTGARKYLTESGDDTTCRAWVWLSDGMYDLDVRDSDAEQQDYGTSKPYGPETELTTPDAERAIEAAGAADLCRPGGVADSLRFSAITTLAVGLGEKGKQNAATFDTMKRVATNEGSSACGKRDASQLGEFVLADDVSSLLFAFDQFVDPQNPPIQQSTKLCPAPACSNDTHDFVLDDTITGLHVLAGADVAQFTAVLTDPAGGTTKIVPGQPIKGAMVSGTWTTDTAFELDLKGEGKSWSGLWKLAFITTQAEGTARSSLRLFGDVEAVWKKPSATWQAGESVDLDLGLAHKDGTAITTVAGTSVLDVAVIAGGQEVASVSGLSNSDLTGPVSLDLTKAGPGAATVKLSLAVTTRGIGKSPGTLLQPSVTTYPVQILPPKAYPTLPATVDFGSSDTADPATTMLTLGGAPGCAWIDPTTAELMPEGVTRADLTSSASQKAPATGELPLTLTVDQLGSGLVGGVVQVSTRAEGCTGEVVSVPVKFSYELERPRDITTFWLTFALVLAAGVLIPVGLLYLIKWLTAKIPGAPLAVVQTTGTLESGVLNSADLTPQNARVLPIDSSGERSLVVSPGVTLETRMGWGLTEPGHVRVSPGPAVTSTGTAKLPLSVMNSWAVALSPTDPHHGPVEVVFVVSVSAEKLNELVADARNRAPGLIARLRESLPESSTPPPAEGGGWGSPGDQGGSGGSDGWGSGGSWGGSGGSGGGSPTPAAGSTSGSGWGSGDSWGSPGGAGSSSPPSSPSSTGGSDWGSGDSWGRPTT